MKDQARTLKQRRRFLIYPEFQLTLIGINALIIGLICSIIYFGTKMGYQNLYAQGIANKLPLEHPYYEFINYQSNMVMTYLVVCLGVGIATSTIFMIIISHRLAGPIVRLKNHFNQTAKSGEFTPVQFRKGDFFKDLPETINEAIKSLK